MPVNRYEFGGLLYEFAREYNALLRQLSAKAGLYAGQPRVLTTIKDNEGCTLSELSEHSGVGMPSLSVSVRNMRKTGLIRSEQTSNARNRGIYLTDSGMEKALHFHKLFDSFLEAFLTQLSPERAEALNRELTDMKGFMSLYSD